MSPKSTPSAAVTEDFMPKSTEFETQQTQAMLERYLLADPTLMEKLVLKSSSREAKTGQDVKAKDTRKYLDGWEKEWREPSS